MPVEYVNYTVANVNGSLWAKIDGTYPIRTSNPGEDLPMVYPIPPGTTNISLWLDERELVWNDYPGLTHHTGIGDWATIFAVLESVPAQFMLRIHYEHPVQVINDSYVFLYDLNIKDYLSESMPNSTAYFTILMDVNFTDLNVSTVSVEGEALKPMNYSLSETQPAKISVTMVSEYSKPLLGDLLFSFKTADADKTVNNGLPVDIAVIIVVGFAIAILVGFVFLRRRRRK